ncbi:hypothetical protein HPB52_015087 [Rhipicephalus sanguineus]|uniref:Uncharacterized protein n=1 Tax=Rhipicephalus sanguineus TaxID=34632 RepID=A0A9D4SX34_RHISA|nr:hypothetical protein HPB52_015087 [Rhipicephalus sanguineus]
MDELNWLHPTLLSCRQPFYLARRTPSRGSGIKELGLREIALVASKILHVDPFTRHNATQRLQLDCLDRKTMRMVAGLPQYYSAADLYAHAANALQDVAEQQ